MVYFIILSCYVMLCYVMLYCVGCRVVLYLLSSLQAPIPAAAGRYDFAAQSAVILLLTIVSYVILLLLFILLLLLLLLLLLMLLLRYDFAAQSAADNVIYASMPAGAEQGTGRASSVPCRVVLGTSS